MPIGADHFRHYFPTTFFGDRDNIHARMKQTCREAVTATVK